MRAPFSKPARALACALGLLATALPLSSPAGAQTPVPDAVSLTLIGQPVWHGADDPLDLQLRITNEGLSTLEGFRLQVGTYPAASSRSELHSNFEIDPLSVELSSLSVDELGTAVPAGTSIDIPIEDPISNLSSLVGAQPGVYPLTVTVTGPDGFTALDTITTQLLYFPEEVEVPLNVVVLWPLVDLPARGSGGIFETAADADQSTVEEATSENGWLTGVLDALEEPRFRSLRLGLSPGGRMVEELGDMGDGYRRADEDGLRTVPESHPAAEAATGALDRLRTIVTQPRVQPVITPYSFATLTSIDDFEHLSEQLTATGSTFEDLLGLTPERAWLFPPTGRLDEVTLARLRSTEAAVSTFFSQDSLMDPVDGVVGCREDFVGITFTCPVIVTTASGRSRGYQLDAELQQRFGALVEDPRSIAELQKLFAELAMIWAELPGTSSRVIALAVPPLWHPPPSVSARFVRSLATGPWVRTRTPRGGLHLGVGAVARELVPEAPSSHSEPDAAFFETVRDASETVDSFARIRPPVTMVQRLKREVLVAESSLWWSGPDRLANGLAFATGARDEAQSELDKIFIGGRRDITLTSRKGPVPLVLQNGTDYEVTLEVHLGSQDRDLELSDRIISETFPPGATALPVQASARASGIYPVRIKVRASDGFEIYETSIRIRSTEFNEIALAITLGALVFLIGFSTIRGIRRRRDPGRTEGEH